MVAAYCELSCLGLDLRPSCITECQAIASRLKLQDRAFFACGDMRDVETTVAKFRNSRRAKGPPIQFGGMFTSIPFWKLETYDTEHKIEVKAKRSGTWLHSSKRASNDCADRA